MEQANILTKRQLRAIDELFESGGNENEVLRKLAISPSKWRRWQAQPIFNKTIEAKMQTLNQNSQMLLLQHSSWVTAKLLEHCNSEKEEVSRKACLSILKLNNKTIEKNTLSEQPLPDEMENTPLTDEQASKILAMLSEMQ